MSEQPNNEPSLEPDSQGQEIADLNKLSMKSLPVLTEPQKSDG